MVQVCPQVQYTSVGSTRMVAVSFALQLDDGELLTGTPTVVEQTTSDLTLGNKAVSTAALTILGETVPIGEAVQFSVSGGTAANSPYLVRVTCGTDATVAQTLSVDVEMVWE